MRRSDLLILAAVIAVVTVYPSVRLPAPLPAPAVVVPAPAVSGVAIAFEKVSASDRAIVASLYAALADAVERDSTIITTMSQLADATGRSLDLAFAGRRISDGSLGDSIDAFVAREAGLDPSAPADVAVTAAGRAKVVAAFRAISVAAGAP